jgi:hypothetical protein
MFRLERVLPALLLLALVIFSAAEARADTLVINGGSVNMTYVAGKWRLGNYDIRWDQGSFVRGSQTDQPGQSSFPSCNGPCAHGSTAVVNGSSNLPTSLPGSFNIPGTIPGDPTLPTSMRSIGGRFNGSLLSFTSGPFVIPDDPHTADGLVTITTNFTAAGTIMVQNIAPDFQTTQVFAGDFLGSGTVTFTFGYVSSFIHTLELRSASYQFQPTPEPATLVLLGSGIAGLAARQRRRSRRRKLQKIV